MKKIVERLLVLVIILLSSFVIARSLFFNYEYTSIFYLAVLSLTLLTSVFAIYGNHRKLTWFFVILVVVISFRAIIPLSTPFDVIDNSPDINYQSQVVEIISATGHLSFNSNDYSGAASNYYGYPLLELLLSVLSKITAIDPIIVIKLFGVALSFPLLLSVVCLYRKVLEKKSSDKLLALSVLLFASCPWVLGFTGLTVHLSLSFPLFVLALAFLLPNRKSSLIVLLLLLSIIITHHFMGFMLIVFIGTYLVVRYVLHNNQKIANQKQITAIHLFFVLTIVLIWAFSIAPATGESILTLATNMLKQILYTPTLSESSTYITPVVGKPFWMLPVQLVGYAAFFGMGAVGLTIFLWKTRMRKKQSSRIDLITLTSLFTTGILLAAPFLLGLGNVIDIMWRSFLFIFLALAPFAAWLLLTINDKFKKNKNCFLRIVGSIGIILMLACILQNGVYAGISYHYYSDSANIQPDDPRLGTSQWVSFAGFSEIHLNKTSLYGVRLAYNFIGSLAFKQVIQIAGDPVLSGNYSFTPIMIANGEFYSNQMICLRKSIINVYEPNNFTFTTDQFNKLPDHYDVIFCSSDALMLKATPLDTYDPANR